MIFLLGYHDNVELEKHVKPTSKKEILGWYSCGFSNEVFSIVSMGTFVPILLEQLVRNSGVLLSNKAIPCVSHGLSYATFSSQSNKDLSLCVIHVSGIGWVDSYSFSLYVYSIASLLQSIIIISVSGLADYGKNRKTLLLIFSIIGSFSAISFIFINKQYFFASFLFILCSICYGASTVLLNAFLPGLSRNHPLVIEECNKSSSRQSLVRGTSFLRDDVSEDYDSSFLDYTKISDSRISALMLDLSSSISSCGIAISYCGALVFQIISIFIIQIIGSGIFSSQIIISASGLWWMVFSIPVAIWLRSRLLPSLSQDILGKPSFIGYILYSWKSLIDTFLDVRKYKDVVIFLAAWFFISNGYSSIISTTVLFAKSALYIPLIGLVVISLLSTLFGILGAFSWPYISQKFKFSPSYTLFLILSLSLFIPVYGIIGLFPISIGLKHPIEIYILAIFFGFLYGGLQGYSRSYFGQLCPENYEARFYALYAVTEKFSSFFGPGIIGCIVDIMHNMRYAFFFLFVTMAISILILVQLKMYNK
ncbi:uncharacterized protein T551_01697 [Pneumocystis jirovecii RU7]|uniref:Autophagy-related protein n=1 Tax=Pneumocystis jirovecii (strain RU7) TaxID=1408657 RepID=A0A0W4ZPX2_PNEJ7|nr:uncharacterized protein T551_01697 [Pneumocystis jirovecii RU7]KTW30414.1 hypothetical protein T551_01697 [Pneumocystis jirovecii RU7]